MIALYHKIDIYVNMNQLVIIDHLKCIYNQFFISFYIHSIMNPRECVRWQIVGAHRFGHNHLSISRVLHVPRTTVRRTIQSYNMRGSVSRQRGSGRPRKTTQRSDRRLIRLARANRFATVPLLAGWWNEPVSGMTLSRRLRQASFKSYRPPVKPYLSPENIRNRLRWTMRRVLWRLPMFRRVVWSDESRFRLFKNDRRTRVWRLRGERFKPDLMQHSFHSQGGSVHVWGAFWYGGRSDLQILIENVNGNRYCEVIRHFIRSSRPPLNWILQQDNAPAHTSQVVTRYFQEAGIQSLPWPSKSPDLNPIEHVWDYIGRKAVKRFPANLFQLRNFLIEEWNRIPQMYLDHLVEGMPRRIGAVVEAHGRNTKY